MTDNIRTIIRSHQFEDELKKIEKEAKRADEFVEGAEFVLCREPTIGTQIGNTHVWFLPVAQSATVSPVVLYYTFDDDRVIFLSITETEYPPR